MILVIACESQKEDPQSAHYDDPVIHSLNQLIDQYPEDPALYLQRGEQFWYQGKYDEAIEDLEKVLSMNPGAYEARHLLADAYLDNLKSRKALETMEMAVNIFPDSIRSKLKLTEFQHILKRYPDALNTIQSIQEMDPDNPDAYFLKGLVLKEVGDTSQAIQQFKLATRENPQLTDAWINAGQLLEASNDSEAIRYFNAGLEVDPQNLNLLHAKAQYLARSEKIEESKAVYQKMSSLDSDYSDAYYDLGLLLLDQDSISQALAHFKIAIQTDPTFQKAYFYAGLTNEILNNYDEALFYFEQALNIDPKDTDARKGRERVRHLIQPAQ